ncbi:uncharacterized protein LOC141638665 [Silene latifolia]|uniref:uncharacterized protein LOC141638665 n=1 Tax=Silene latifolia TaxID=37657 RepID=UPI003D786B61
MRVVEHKCRPTIGAVFASLEAGIKFYEVYARACGFTPRKHSTKTLRGGVAHQKFVVCNRQGFRESKPKQRPRTKDDENMGDGSSTTSTLHGELKSQELDAEHTKTLILDNSKLNIGSGLTFRQVKELVNGYENIGATLIDFKNFQRDIKCYIGLRDADLFIDRLEKLKATQLDSTSPMMLSLLFSRQLGIVIVCGILHKRSRTKLVQRLCRDTDFLARFNAVVWDPDMEPSEFEEKWQKVISDFELEDNDWLTTMFQIAMDKGQRYTRRCDDYNGDHSFPELKTELPIEKHGAIIYTHAVFKVFQEEVMAADSCGVDDFEKEEHVRIIHAYFVGVQGQRNWANTKQVHCRSLDSNGNVIEDSYMATSNNSHLCNVWSEFCQIVGVLKTLPAEHTEELASLLVEFRQKLCIETLTKDQEMEMLLGCSSSSEVTIHPPEQARNKGSGKRLKSAKQQAIEKAAKPKRLCAYCK